MNVDKPYAPDPYRGIEGGHAVCALVALLGIEAQLLGHMGVSISIALNKGHIAAAGQVDAAKRSWVAVEGHLAELAR